MVGGCCTFDSNHLPVITAVILSNIKFVFIVCRALYSHNIKTVYKAVGNVATSIYRETTLTYWRV
jgi:hypothetical protein